jgi:gas vesicle protein
MGESTSAIREEIEATRDRMGSTVDALGYKADVPARAKESIGDTFQSAKDRLSGVGSTVSSQVSQVSDAAPSRGDVKQTGQRAVSVAQQNPLGLAIGAAALGFIAGMLIPSTDVEDQRIGEVSDQIKTQAIETGQDALEHGKQIVQETADAATDKAQEVAGQIKESAQDTAQTVAASARDAASDVKQTAQDSAQQHAEDLSASAQDSVEEVQHAAGDAGPDSNS